MAAPYVAKTTILVLRECEVWCRETESNRRHKALQASALPLSYPGTNTRPLSYLFSSMLSNRNAQKTTQTRTPSQTKHSYKRPKRLIPSKKHVILRCFFHRKPRDFTVSHPFLNDAQALLIKAQQACSAAQTVDALEQFRIAFLGRKGELAALSDRFVTLSLEDKRSLGKEFQEIKQALERLYDDKKKTFDLQTSTTTTSAFDVTEEAPQRTHSGALHVYTHIIERIEDIFIPMGYSKFEGPEVEDEFHNFDALNVPANHPARDMHDTLWINRAHNLLRTHTSSVQIRSLEKFGVPIAGFSPGRVFRHEAVDATHDVMFMQCEGIFIDKNVSLSNLLGTAKHFLSTFFETKDLDIRIRPGFFPFVEPGLEIDMRCVFCKTGCSVCKKTTWIEVFPCGMIHPNVLRAVNIDPEVYSGFAFGFGLSRLVMLYHGIDDIRHLSTGKIGFLKQF